MNKPFTRETLYIAAINCGHEIDDDVIMLSRDPNKPGNALSQLGDRLAEAAKDLRPEGWSTLGVGDGAGELFVHGPHDAIKVCQRWLIEGPADAARLNKLEELALDGVVSLGVELDGGVHLTIELVGEEGRAFREKNTIRDAIDCERRGEAGLPVRAVATAAAPAPQPPSPERLLEIARVTGLRERMHGVAPGIAREVLYRFFEAASRPDAAGTSVQAEARALGICGDPPTDDPEGWIRLRWWRDEIHRSEASQAFMRLELLNEEQAVINHGMTLKRLRARELSPNEALAIVKRVPAQHSVLNEEGAFNALVALVQRLEGAPA